MLYVSVENAFLRNIHAFEFRIIYLCLPSVLRKYFGKNRVIL